MNGGSLMQITEAGLFCSDGSVSQSQDDSIVGTRQCRHSLAIMPIPGTLSSSSPDLLQPTTSILDFSNPSGNTAAWGWCTGWLARQLGQGENCNVTRSLLLSAVACASCGPNWRCTENPHCLNLSCLLFLVNVGLTYFLQGNVFCCFWEPLIYWSKLALVEGDCLPLFPLPSLLGALSGPSFHLSVCISSSIVDRIGLPWYQHSDVHVSCFTNIMYIQWCVQNPKKCLEICDLGLHCCCCRNPVYCVVAGGICYNIQLPLNMSCENIFSLF